MKTFHFQLGNKAFDTMTVAEMRKILEEHDDDTVLIATWEGIRTPVREPVLVENFHFGKESEACFALIIDVNQY